jgi:ubiquinone/menaquinone biosynthesis C-methylase UbiE
MEIDMQRRTIWDFWAGRYERVPGQPFALGPARTLIHQHLDVVAPHAGRILDIGCGVGQLACELAQRRPAAQIVAADTSPGMIARARRDYAAPNVIYVQASIDDIARDEAFDVIVSTHALPYFPDKPGAVRAMYGLLRPGGRVLILQANKNNLYDAIWLFFVKFTTSKAEYCSVEVLQSILGNAGFKLGVVRSIDTWFFVPSVYLVEGLK